MASGSGAAKTLRFYEEQGKIGEAIGDYRALMGQTDERLRELKRHVSYFYIIALAKREQFALAADEAVRWFQIHDRREERDSVEGLGVAYELARAGEYRLHQTVREGDLPTLRLRMATANRTLASKAPRSIQRFAATAVSHVMVAAGDSATPAISVTSTGSSTPTSPRISRSWRKAPSCSRG